MPRLDGQLNPRKLFLTVISIGHLTLVMQFTVIYRLSFCKASIKCLT
ncbi:hypothetical protein LPICM02_180012 [Pseudolactococcus piscium]|nr:hypothetical protein LPICM02_180012 [Lactococcus piscium]